MSWDVSRTCLPSCRRAGRIFAISATLCFLGESRLDLGYLGLGRLLLRLPLEHELGVAY